VEEAVTLYPNGYGTSRITLEQMIAQHGAKMHPEFSRRFFAYMAYKKGLLGVGGGWRSTQPTLPGFAPDGKSFHQDQQFASGRIAYAAVDLVVPVVGGAHRSPTWAECADAPLFGLHTFITGEPWHIQCIEMRGWQTWVNAGRPDPKYFVLPGEQPLPPPPIPQPEEIEMALIVVHNNVGPKETWLSWTGPHLAHVVGHAAHVLLRLNAPRVDITDSKEADSLIRSATTTNACPPEWVGTPRGAIWTSQRA
jgi:hypothetical protein